MSKHLEENKVDNAKEGAYITTNTGVKISNTDDSLKAGTRGPTLLEDFHFREKINHFDHERIPERVVHARGTGAHGYFELYHPLPHLTKASFLNTTATHVPVFVRFSTVLGSRGSADTVRDVRGFAVRFYTEEGNFDLVGNNIPVFFIQDAIKFPDVIHAGKPEPQFEIPQAQTAHDNFWDFVSLSPETIHMIMWAMSDRAIPRSYRMIQGFGVHTFCLVNKDHVRRFVKFHWKPVLGVHGQIWDECQKLAGQDPDFHRRDLVDAIAAGSFPEWELGLQVVEEKDEHSFEFDLLDPTKIIPEELVPVQWVGKMVLNRNTDDFFAETEQIAFCTQNIVPGIDFSDDPLLQGRNFSYLDTQLTRLGGPNFSEIPINRPVCPVLNNQRDGFMRTKVGTSNFNYFPNRSGWPRPAPEKEGGFVHFAEKIAGIKERMKAPKFLERYNQATLFWNSITAIEKDHLVSAAVFELSKCEEKATQQKVIEHFNHVEPAFAKRVAAGLGLEPPSPIPGWKNHGQQSPALSMDDGPYAIKGSIRTRKVAFLLADGFEVADVKEMKKAVEEKGGLALIVAPHSNLVKSSSGESFPVNFTIYNSKSTFFDAVFVPGGNASFKTLIQSGDAEEFVNEAFKHYKPISAVGEGVEFLKQGCTLPGIKLATDKDECLEDHGVVTGNKIGSKVQDTFKFAVGQHRFWTRDVSKVPA